MRPASATILAMMDGMADRNKELKLGSRYNCVPLRLRDEARYSMKGH